MGHKLDAAYFYETVAENEDYFFLDRRDPSMRYHFHGAVELLFVAEGLVKCVLNGKEHLLMPGKACFIDSFVAHSYEACTGGCCAYVVVSDSKWCNRMFDLKGGRVPPRIFDYDDTELLQTLYDLFGRTNKIEDGEKYVHRGIIALLLGDISTKVDFVQRSASKETDLVRSVLSYANEHLSRDLSLHAVANHFGYSPDHLSRVLKAYLPASWSKYVNAIRIRKAAELLRTEPGRTVLDIAYDCGFGSASTFYRAYRDMYGEKPKR